MSDFHKSLSKDSILMKANRTLLVHAHIFKNAGRTLDKSLKDQLGGGFSVIRNNQSLRKNPNTLNKIVSENEELTAVSSHKINLQHMHDWEFDCIPFIMIRHPLERVKSVYNYNRLKPARKTKSAIAAKNLSFPEFVQWILKAPNFVVRNHQIRFCTGNINEELTEESIQSAMDLIDKIPVTGCVDQYDESVVLLEDSAMNQGINLDLSYLRRNQTQNPELSVHEKLESIREELGSVYAQIEEENRLDLQLYENAKAILNDRISSDENFEQNMDNFRSRCRKIESEQEAVKPLSKI